MKKHIITLAVFMFVGIAHSQVSPTIYQTAELVVTLDDFKAYLVARDVTKVQEAQALAKPGAIREIMDRILVIKAMSDRAEGNPAINRDAIEAKAADHRMRLLMLAQLDLDIDAALAGVEWDALALDEYKAFPEKHQTSETVRASHILISSGDRSTEELDARVNDVLNALANGRGFDELAIEFSDDPGSAAQGGDLGYFGSGRMVKEFEDAAFALGVGEVSEPVSSQFGTHIIMVTGKKEAGLVPFDQVKPKLIAGLKRKERARAQEVVFERVKSDMALSGLTVNEELLKELEASYGVPQEPELPKP